jgi:nucleotide-binding universal stress UspA family protein
MAHAEAGRLPAAPDRNEVASPVIVVGLDGSPSSWDAFCWAVGEAGRISGKVVAVYAIPFIDPATSFSVTFAFSGAKQAKEELADKLKSEAVQRANEQGVALSFVTEHGEVTHALTDVARELQANLIVVGRSAKLLHRLSGSLSHRLTSRNDAPVVVVVP